MWEIKYDPMENFTGDLEYIKINKMEILECKNTINEINNLIDLTAELT